MGSSRTWVERARRAQQRARSCPVSSRACRNHVGHGARGGNVHARQEAGCQDNVQMSRVGEGVLVVRVQRAAQPGCPLRIRHPVRTTRPTA
jgi:hypothetical protein